MVALLAQEQSNRTFPIDEVIHGNCLEVLKTLPDNSIDAIVCDPPAGISFMGKNWDNFSGKSKTYDSAGGRAKANANKEKLKQYEQGTTPFAFSGSGMPTKKERDAFIAFMTSVMSEALRVLKPGGYGLVWALPRTSHWTALALEDAGFIVKDCVSHIFGSGFPKSMDISKAIDKMQGAEREVIGSVKRTMTNSNLSRQKQAELGYRPEGDKYPGENGVNYITAPATPEAHQWNGYGTALKPSTEFWWLVQKPISEKSIAANVLKWNCGALNIDGCRVGWEHGGMDGQERTSPRPFCHTREMTPRDYKPNTQGRFPSHLLLSHSLFCVQRGVKRVRGSHDGGKSINHTGKQHNTYSATNSHTNIGYADSDGMEEVEDWECVENCPIRILNEQSGIRKSAYPGNPERALQQVGKPKVAKDNGWGSIANGSQVLSYSDQGGASRYFTNLSPDADDFVPYHYFSKASRAERNAGCEGLPKQFTATMNDGIGKREHSPDEPNAWNGNNHPTVKSLSLMSWLCRLITPPDGIVLDPFAGSGSTLVACVHEGFHFIGIEQDESYVTIAEARIAHALKGGV